MEIISEVKKDTYAVKFTATENGEVLGWVYLFLIFESRHNEPYGLMGNLYIEMGHRGKGIGTKLIQIAIEEAKKRGCYKLICNGDLSNERAHKLYERLGFKKHGLEFRMDLMASPIMQRD